MYSGFLVYNEFLKKTKTKPNKKNKKFPISFFLV
jgi:hypothetical protein